MSAENWRSAYLRRARSDFEILEKLLASHGISHCHRLHYLQMTTEKLAKGVMTAGTLRPPRTHDAFVKFLRIARGRPDILGACGYSDAGQFSRFIDSLLPTAQLVKNLSPEGTDHPNPEYPWEAHGRIFSPLDASFEGLQFNDARMQKLLMFLRRLAKFA